MNTPSPVRLVLWLTPEEKFLLSEFAARDDRPMSKWAIRTLREALGLSPSPVLMPPEGVSSVEKVPLSALVDAEEVPPSA